MKKLLLLPMALLLVLICGQAYPPASSGGAQADPLTLGGGIVSADGGVFTGHFKVTGQQPADGGAIEVIGGINAIWDGGYPGVTIEEVGSTSTASVSPTKRGIYLHGPGYYGLGVCRDGTGCGDIYWTGFNWNIWQQIYAPNGILIPNGGTLGITSSVASGSWITNTSGGYPQIMKVAAGAPAGADCDAAGEAGRQYYDSTANQMFVCVGAGGWKSVLYPL